MDVRHELNESLKRFTDRQLGILIQSGTVESYNATAKTVDVKLHDGTVLYDVNLSPTNLPNQFIQVPKIGSWVYIGEMGRKGGIFSVLVYSEIDKLTAKIGATEFEMTADGVKILRGSTNFEIAADGVEILRGTENLKTVFDELFTELITSFTAISAVVPITNLPKYELLKQRLDSILK